MTDTVDLAKERRVRSDDNRDWTPEDALEDALNDIRNGDEPCDTILVVRLSRNEDGSWHRVGYQMANLSITEAVALAEYLKARLLDVMRGGEF